MKKIFALLFSVFVAFSAFAQTAVAEKKLGKTLEKNKNADAFFVSEIELSQMTVSDDGKIMIPILAKNKISVVSGMDMANLKERIARTGKTTFNVTFETKNLKSKTYAIIKIEGIESAESYNTYLAEQAKIAEEQRIAEEKRRAEEAKTRREQERLLNLTKLPVQVVNLEIVNLSPSESSWLPGQIQDKFKSNLQEYLGMKTVVDSKSENALKKLQRESESAARDENTAIELGKITTAKFALFSKIRKTGKGYIITVDFTDLTTGEQMASAASKEYSEVEYLYGSTGAVDEITLLLADKLGIKISDLNKNLLSTGSSSFSVDEQLALAKENEENFKKMMAQYDSQLKKLSVSNDLSAVENAKKIEAEKVLLQEKQKAEQKREQELLEQKKRADADAKLEAERSIALKTQRDKMAQEASAKAAEVRKLKIAKQGVLGQISIIESKKKALVEIRNSVEARSQELFAQFEKDRKSEEQRIRNKSYSTVEMENGKPTKAAVERREKQVVKSYEDLTNKFFADCDAVAQSTMSQQNALLSEIRADQKALATTRTVSSMGDELKVSFGTYASSQNGWNAYLSLYSDGVLLYKDSFIVGYEALSGKKAPDMATELNDSVIEEYTNNVDMYNSLLTRGDPIIYFELDYTATAEADDKPSEYKFNFNKIRVINTVSGKTVQTSTLSKVLPRTMKPAQDLRERDGIVAKEKDVFAEMEKYIANGYNLTFAIIAYRSFMESIYDYLINIPNQDFAMLKIEVPQKLYTEVMGENPSYFKDDVLPVERVSWYDAIYFCNKLSKKCGLTPVYSEIKGKITQNSVANGFRLPTVDEWKYAAKGGEDFRYSGSDNLDEVGWYVDNSGKKTHPVAQKKPNGYGLYDMSGNVCEWMWDSCTKLYGHKCKDNSRHNHGGSYCSYDSSCEVWGYDVEVASEKYPFLGFRIVRTISK